MLISPLLRKLNPGVDYHEFHAAWLPDEPRKRVISALNLNDPSELLTIALIDADPAEVPGWLERMAPIEARRGRRITGMVGPPTYSGVYRVVSEDDLSRPR